MTTNIDEIAPCIYRLSTLVRHGEPTGFTFNQFVLEDGELLLLHAGHRSMFPTLSEGSNGTPPLDRVRRVAFGHVESHERRAMNELLVFA